MTSRSQVPRLSCEAKDVGSTKSCRQTSSVSFTPPAETQTTHDVRPIAMRGTTLWRQFNHQISCEFRLSTTLIQRRRSASRMGSSQPHFQRQTRPLFTDQYFVYIFGARPQIGPRVGNSQMMSLT